MNVFEAIGHVGEDILKGIEWPFVNAAKISAVIGDTLKDEPEVKQVIVQLVQKAESVTPDFVTAIGANGINVSADLKSLADVQTFFQYFKNTFLPVIEKAYAEIKKDVQTATAAPSSPAPAAAELTTGPGLHNVVPA